MIDPAAAIHARRRLTNRFIAGREAARLGPVFLPTAVVIAGDGSVITGRDEQAIVNEVERGEDYLKEKFETALNAGTLSGECRAVVERAYQSVRSGHDQVSALKHGLEA